MRNLIKITIHDLPLSQEEIESLAKQYDASAEKLETILDWFIDSIDGTDEIDIRYLLHHVLNSINRLKRKGL